MGQSGSGFSNQPDSGDTVIGGGGGNVPVGANRNNWGLFGEWYVPILKNLEATAPSDTTITQRCPAISCTVWKRTPSRD